MRDDRLATLYSIASRNGNPCFFVIAMSCSISGSSSFLYISSKSNPLSTTNIVLCCYPRAYSQLYTERDTRMKRLFFLLLLAAALAGCGGSQTAQLSPSDKLATATANAAVAAG